MGKSAWLSYLGVVAVMLALVSTFLAVPAQDGHELRLLTRAPYVTGRMRQTQLRR